MQAPHELTASPPKGQSRAEAKQAAEPDTSIAIDTESVLPRPSMERSIGQRHLLTIFLLLLVSAACIAGAEAQSPGCKAPDPCDSQILAWLIGSSCAGGLDHPSEMCCQGVVAAVGIRFGDTVEVPCLCRVAKERYLGVVGLDIQSILRMYTTCDGVLPVGPGTAEACQGRV